MWRQRPIVGLWSTACRLSGTSQQWWVPLVLNSRSLHGVCNYHHLQSTFSCLISFAPHGNPSREAGPLVSVPILPEEMEFGEPKVSQSLGDRDRMRSSHALCCVFHAALQASADLSSPLQIRDQQVRSSHSQDWAHHSLKKLMLSFSNHSPLFDVFSPSFCLFGIIDLDPRTFAVI